MHTGEALQCPVVWHPLDAAEALKLKQSLGQNSVYISGGTLLRTQWEAGIAAMPLHLIDLSGISGTSGVTVQKEEMIIGAQTLLSTIRYDSNIATFFPLLADAVRQIAAPSIRNQASIGGNIVSVVGDAIPALLVYGAELIWQDGLETETIELKSWMLQPEVYQSDPSRLLLHIRLPLESQNTNTKRFSAYHKVGRREVFTPSVVTVALSGSIDEHGMLSDVRIAAGGGQTPPHRLSHSEDLLEGNIADQELLTKLYESIIKEFEPIGDLFAGVAYRKQIAANLIVTELWKLAAEWEGKE
ncbi:FAD binding domain-containing protein [Cohnella sp.]|uniref:FAD binding domain-containing protein n=1 Tax=Cohnella sp. TaxID=1883426 RepID=UPI0035672C81